MFQRFLWQVIPVLALVSACSSGPGNPSAVAAPAPAAPLALRIAVTVSNTHFGNGTPSDVKVGLAIDGGAPTAIDVSKPFDAVVPRGSQYAVTVTPLDGYTTKMSSGCSGAASGTEAQCDIGLADVNVTCDPRLWDPVYSKDRLRVVSKCEVATGTVRGFEVERDGDLEVWLEPDAKYSFLMRPGNHYSRGWLVLEIPCQAPIVQEDAMGTCDQYRGDKARVPLTGEHVVVAGPWVEDKTHHSWAELHGAVLVKLPH